MKKRRSEAEAEVAIVVAIVVAVAGGDRPEATPLVQAPTGLAQASRSMHRLEGVGLCFFKRELVSFGVSLVTLYRMKHIWRKSECIMSPWKTVPRHPASAPTPAAIHQIN
jgi:hypothetical protein